MTTKVTDQDVLNAIGTIPQSCAEIGRKIDLHRSNVAPRMLRLQKAGLVKAVADRWIRTDTQANQTVPGTRMTPAQVAFCEDLLGIGDDFEIDDERIDIGSTLLVEDLLTNLRDIYDENESLDILRAISSYCDDYEPEDEPRVDELLNRIRELITGEPATKLTRAQAEFAAKVLYNEDEDMRILYDRDFEHPLEVIEVVTQNLQQFHPESGTVGALAEIVFKANNGIDSDDIPDIDYYLDALREIITDEPSPKLTQDQLELSAGARIVFQGLKDKRMQDTDIAKLLGCPIEDVNAIVVEMEEEGLLDKSLGAGSLYYSLSRRGIKLSGN